MQVPTIPCRVRASEISHSGPESKAQRRSAALQGTLEAKASHRRARDREYRRKHDSQNGNGLQQNRLNDLPKGERVSFPKSDPFR